MTGGTAISQKVLIKTLERLIIHEPKVGRKVRIGPLGDGGAVVCNWKLSKGFQAISFQSSRQSVEFEQDLAIRGMSTTVFNSALAPSIVEQPAISFKHVPYEDRSDFVEAQLNSLLSTDNCSLLRIDLEGMEYDVIPNIDSGLISGFDQVLIEFHGLSRLSSPEFNERLNLCLDTFENFKIIHIHANNHAGITIVNGLAVPEVIDVTLLRRELTGGTSKALLPSCLDFASHLVKQDLLLWFYPFIQDNNGISAFEKSRQYSLRWLEPLTASKPRPTREVMLRKDHVKYRTKKTMKIIYFSCHEILEFDDLEMFTERGHRVFSLGSFTHKDQSSQGFRTAHPHFFDEEMWNLFNSTGCNFASKTLTSKFVEFFDVVIVNHVAAYIVRNLDALKNIPVVYRSVGQSSIEAERDLPVSELDLSIVRYSDLEGRFQGARKADRCIYFGKDLTAFPQWKGGGGVRSFHNSYVGRQSVATPSISFFNELAADFDIELFGANNHQLIASRGLASPEEQMRLYASTDVYFYIYTVSPSYTLSFIEAMAAGVPILAPSAELVLRSCYDACSKRSFGAERYEIERLLGHDERLIYSSVGEARSKLSFLMENEAVRREISAQMRSAAEKVFDSSKNVLQWEDFFDRITTR